MSRRSLDLITDPAKGRLAGGVSPKTFRSAPFLFNRSFMLSVLAPASNLFAICGKRLLLRKNGSFWFCYGSEKSFQSFLLLETLRHATIVALQKVQK